MKEFLDKCKYYFKFAFFFSMFINILQLTFPIFMLLVFDKVISGQSISTLVVLTVTALGALCLLGILMWLRSRLLASVGVKLDHLVAQEVLSLNIHDSGGPQGMPAPDTGSLGDVQILRNYLSSTGMFAFFDLPWVPLYIICMFLLHFYMGMLGLVGAILVFTLGFLTERLTRKRLEAATNMSALSTRMSTSAMRNADIIRSMGMIGNISREWDKINKRVLTLQTLATNKAGGLKSISSSMRMGLQVMVYAIGAYLAVQNEATAGIMIAASIVMGKALNPIDMGMASYKSSIRAWQAYTKLTKLTERKKSSERMRLPDPTGAIAAENLYFAAQGRPIIKGVSMRMAAGQSVAIIGASASGKSTLCKLLLNIWQPTAGKVRLDNADITNYDPEKLGPFLGYLPQDVELFNGTLAENICRMGPVNPEKVIRAAKMAGVHEMVLRFPQGYDTYINQTAGLSGGQRQRLGLARALYGDPRIVVLDEPNSNLDEEGEVRLAQAILQLREMKSTVILVTHKPQILNVVENLVVMQDGQIVMSGPVRQVLAKIAKTSQPQSQARTEEKPIAQDSAQGNARLPEDQHE